MNKVNCEKPFSNKKFGFASTLLFKFYIPLFLSETPLFSFCCAQVPHYSIYSVNQMDVDKRTPRSKKVSKKKYSGMERRKQNKTNEKEKTMQNSSEKMAKQLHPITPTATINPDLTKITQIFESQWNFNVTSIVNEDFRALLSIDQLNTRKVTFETSQNTTFKLISYNEKYILFDILEKKTVLVLYQADKIYIASVDTSCNISSISALNNVFPISRLDNLKFDKVSSRWYLEADQPQYMKLSKKLGRVYQKRGHMPFHIDLQCNGQNWNLSQGEWRSYIDSVFTPFSENSAIIQDKKKVK